MQPTNPFLLSPILPIGSHAGVALVWFRWWMGSWVQRLSPTEISLGDSGGREVVQRAGTSIPQWTHLYWVPKVPITRVKARRMQILKIRKDRPVGLVVSFTAFHRLSFYCWKQIYLWEGKGRFRKVHWRIKFFLLLCNNRIQFSFIQKPHTFFHRSFWEKVLYLICSVLTLQNFRECR